MEQANPALEANPETSQKERENALKIVEVLGEVQYLLTIGYFSGKEVERVARAKDFLIAWRAHLTDALKQQ